MISSLELARLCGVSQGTVDRALHGRPGISEATRRKVLDAAREHGYRPNPAVTELLGGQRLLVGGIVPSLGSLFFMDLFNAIKEQIAQDGYRLLITPVQDAAEFSDALKEFAARRFAAAVVVPPQEGMDLPALGKMQVFTLASECRGATLLAPDEIETGRRGVRYLASLGHRRILHLTYSRQARGIEHRQRGYEQAMRELGLEPAIIRGWDERAIARAIGQTGRPAATAVFCHNDWLALQTRRLAASMGLDVPRQLSVLGVDDSPTFTSICPDMTTMRYPFADVARAAAQLLRQKKVGRIPACEIIERATCARLV